jgi:hypothetical protein
MEDLVGLERPTSPYPNFRRSKWGVGISPQCTRCGRGDETTTHVFRDYFYATQVWLHLVPSNFFTNFFNLDCMN